MTSGTLVLLGAALLCGCGSNSTSKVAETQEASTDAPSSDAGSTPPDATPDVSTADAPSVDAAVDVEKQEAAPPSDAGSDAACTPLKFPLPPPAQCQSDQGPFITAPGRYWYMQLGTYACSSNALAASAACEMCTENYNCACLRPLVGDGGAMCIDGTTGPFFSQ